MNIVINGGTLQPKVHDGTAVDAVYGVAADGSYLGVVPAAQATARADRPPPSRGTWRWSNGDWHPFVSRDTQVLLIEQERDRRLSLGVSWNGNTWYTDPTFQQLMSTYLGAYTQGIFAADATVDVRSMDKVVHALTASQLRALAAAVIAYVDEVWQWSWDQKALIEA